MLVLYFNPRPRKEGDVEKAFLNCIYERFQSTPSQRGRHEFLTKNGYLPDISIHALAKRATHIRTKRIYYTSYFNPRPRKEGDAWNMILSPRSRDFNPRPRKEGDNRYLRRYFDRYYFNPRPRKEGDNGRYNNVWYYGNFNPRPRKEGDRILWFSARFIIYFNPRPRKEGDQLYSAD